MSEWNTNSGWDDKTAIASSFGDGFATNGKDETGEGFTSAGNDDRGCFNCGEAGYAWFET